MPPHGLVQEGTEYEIWAFRYERLYSTHPNSMLWLMQATSLDAPGIVPTRRVYFQSPWNAGLMQWHGSWRRSGPFLEVFFNARGPDAPLRSVHLHQDFSGGDPWSAGPPRPREIFVGFDYAERRIRLTEIDFIFIRQAA